MNITKQSPTFWTFSLQHAMADDTIGNALVEWLCTSKHVKCAAYCKPFPHESNINIALETTAESNPYQEMVIGIKKLQEHTTLLRKQLP